MDRQMNNLLKWSIQNSSGQQQQPGQQPPRSDLSPEVLSSILGGPSEADLMKSSMATLHSDQVNLEDKLTAFDNFEQLVESIDNANNLEPLGLWTPLVQLLEHDEADMRRMAAACVGTAVQNNEKGQDKVSSPANGCL